MILSELVTAYAAECSSGGVRSSALRTERTFGGCRILNRSSLNSGCSGILCLCSNRLRSSNGCRGRTELILKYAVDIGSVLYQLAERNKEKRCDVAEEQLSSGADEPAEYLKDDSYYIRTIRLTCNCNNADKRGDSGYENRACRYNENNKTKEFKLFAWVSKHTAISSQKNR